MKHQTISKLELNDCLNNIDKKYKELGSITKRENPKYYVILP